MPKATVPMKDYVDALRAADIRYQDMLDRKNDKAVELANTALDQRTKVALDAVTEHNVKSNGLIEMMRGMMSEFINWRVVMSFLSGAGIVSGIYFGFVK
jgi:hypothetical protein